MTPLQQGVGVERSVGGQAIRDATVNTPHGVQPAIGDHPARRKPRLTRRYQDVLERAPDATIVADGNGRIRLVNRQTEVLFGYARQDLLNQPVEVLIPERFQRIHQHHRADYAAAPHTRPMGANLHLFGRRHDGSEFPVEVSLAPFDDAGEALVIASIRDISELQRVHAARREAEQANRELRQLQALTDTALAHLDLDELLPELLSRVRDVMAVDNAAILLLDAARQELRVRAAFGPEEEVAAGVRVPLGEGFAGRIAASREPLIVEDLSHFPVVSPFLRERLRSAVGVPLLLREGVLGVVHVGTVEPHRFTAQDVQLLQRVAERMAVAIERAQLYEQTRAALAEAQASAARFRRLVEAGMIGIAMGDAQHVIEANEALLQMLGYTRQDLEAGRVPWGQQTSEADAASAKADEHARQELLTLGACTPYEREFVRPDGTRLPVLLGLALLSREPLEWVCYAVDVSERKWLEREREEARASELAVREVNQHLDEFFRVAAHDLRNPVAVAKGYVELALRQLEYQAASARVRDGQQAEAMSPILDSVRHINHSVDYLRRLTAQMFDLARARTGTLELRLASLDLAALVRDHVSAQRAASPDRVIQLELPESDRPVWVQADGDRVRQVLSNYLTNALKYSPQDRPVEVRLEVVEQLAVVSVRDQGPGLPWEEQSRVWEMLHRAPGVEVQSGSEGSLGMGLHICKRLIELHPGGRVGVESVVAEGSTFWFRLQVAPEPSANQGASHLVGDAGITGTHPAAQGLPGHASPQR
ncbi:MAG TPA: PAS domain S-box protein [Ktedonobacterales bacterium]|nr:PAS domain S-box protein [Ktedonobacterales bacterium]